MIIYRLLKNLSPDDYCLISRQEIKENGNNYSRKLPGNYYHLPPEFETTGGELSGMARWTRRFKVLLNTVFGLGILLRGRRITKIARRERCDAIVACTGGDLLDLPAGYLASRRLGVNFYAYVFDDYLYVWPKMRRFAARLESFLMKRAAGVITPNEFMRNELHLRYGINPVVIRNACDVTEYEGIQAESPKGDAAPRIVYTGAIYDAHYDAFRNLLRAVELTKQAELKLHLYTAFPLAELRANGIDGPIVYHEHQSVSTMPGIQRQADILFLPLAFSSPYPEMIRTSAPGKVGEYLAAGKPILVHAPPDSFVAWYFREHECGVVVDEQDPRKLAEAIDGILTDRAFREKLSRRASERARVDFDVQIARRRFAELMKIDLAH
jgi:glycosyltransferase involved in cell wall biosynthesis